MEVNDDGGNDSVPTYSEAFPPLAPTGTSNLTEIASSLAENEWINPKMKRIRSIVVTQVETCRVFVI